MTGGSIGEGIPGQVLRRICSVWVRAQRSGVLGPSQEKIAEKAQILLDALADVAIVALIDEATGYQKRRAHDALQKIHSKKVANHAHMVALYTLFYNFIRTHGKLRMTPAMAAGIATTFMSFEDVLARVDKVSAPKVRGPYKKRAA
jgi:hypothetical protein